jgi:hypothetical protein
MIVHKLDVVSVPFTPAEADAPLVVDANAVLTGSVAFQRLQPVARRYPQGFQRSGGMNLDELSIGSALEVARHTARVGTAEDQFRALAAKALDHVPIVTLYDSIVKR